MNEFLRNSSNKNQLFSYLAERDDCLKFEDKDITVTKLTEVTFCTSSSSESDLVDLDIVSPSDHEEADTRMILQSFQCPKQGLKNILIHIVDIDVVVLAVHFLMQ